MISFSEQLHEYIVKNLTFPLSNYMFNRKNILSKFNAMRESEWYSAKTLKELQFNKLRKVIEYANAYVPYYRDKLKEIGLFPEDIKNLEDLQYIVLNLRGSLLINRKEGLASLNHLLVFAGIN